LNDRSDGFLPGRLQVIFQALPLSRVRLAVPPGSIWVTAVTMEEFVAARLNTPGVASRLATSTNMPLPEMEGLFSMGSAVSLRTKIASALARERVVGESRHRRLAGRGNRRAYLKLQDAADELMSIVVGV
jgi:hypothetical protein